MKKIVKFLAIAYAVIMLAGCNGQKLFIYNWTYYIPDEVLKGFEKEYNCKIVYDMFTSNEEMFTKLKAGATGYDLTFPSGDYVSIMIKEGMLQRIDMTKIPNFQYVEKSVLEKIKFDRDQEYSVPFMMAGSGVAINTDVVKDYKKDMSVFSNPAYSGRMTLLDDMREVFGYALKALGYSVNSVDAKQLEEAKDLIMEWKKNILKFDAESFGKGFAAGEFVAVQGYAENVFLELDEAGRNRTVFFIPESGGPMYMDCMVLLNGAKNVELAYQFMNYIHRPDVYAKICDFLMLPSINIEARNYTKVKTNYTIEDLKNSELKENIGDALELYNKFWQDIRIGN
ncbi:MAG TPA: extracellular solute-binding protein [Spirochaetota bacterium]|jgi:spermidine/putrescine transport system substrate-binding protein|nr:MAG: Spermidine/putrescine-binding periplasmic protein precursor [Spirochaetes bacterium ADurb.Bin133]HNZ26064.1 extracellular solute-binding protein [Spirochaetota bacterium]HPY86545.1 extracellular solute-binding protein [Spirochaetota bacterium]HQB61515.1 extracellular solute-binding protein [Spirochaetota bacterium]